MGNGNIFDHISPNAIWRGFKSSFGGITDPEKAVIIKDKLARSSPDLVKSAGMFGRMFIRVAGISGAAAVAMGAYGTHGFFPKKDVPDELKDVYRTANYYHFLHSLVLLSVPLTRRPMIVGPLIISGMSIFCGTCYFHALTGDPAVKQFTPYGGVLLILGWLSMLL